MIAEGFPQSSGPFCFIIASACCKNQLAQLWQGSSKPKKLKTNDQGISNTASLNENCFWELDLYTGLLHWSDGMCQLLGLQKPYTPTLAQLMQYFGPEQNIRTAFSRAIHQGTPFQLQLPSLTVHDKVILVCTTGFPVYDDYGKCIAIKGALETETPAENQSNPLQIAAEETEAQQMVLDNFARIVSHNLRSHTANLQMVIESVQQKTVCGDMQELIGSIKTISQNLNQTVGYLNTLTKI